MRVRFVRCYRDAVERRSLSAIAALADDLRRRLYALIRSAGRPVSREEAAAGVGISRKLAAFHLDKLVHAGLLDAGRDAPPKRRDGPGRAPKVYLPSQAEFQVTIPERRYEIVGDILAEAVAEAGNDVARSAALRIAHRNGAELGSAVRAEAAANGTGDAPPDAAGVVEGLGYEPAADGDVVLLRNCPYHQLAEQQRALVCAINLAFLDGLLHGLGDGSTRAVLAPGAGRCCVELRADSPR